MEKKDALLREQGNEGALVIIREKISRNKKWQKFTKHNLTLLPCYSRIASAAQALERLETPDLVLEE